MRQITLFLALGILASLSLLAACGGGSRASSIGVNTPVTSAESPIPNTSGVRTTLDEGVQVFLLSENTNAEETKHMSIISDPNKTDGEKSGLAGKTFLEFRNLSGFHDVAGIMITEISEVYECELAAEQCILIPFKANYNGVFSFYVQEGRFYAVKK